MEANCCIVTSLVLCLWSSFSFYFTSSQSDSQNPRGFSDPKFVSAVEPVRGTYNKLGKPLVGDDGCVYVCVGKDMYGFKRNGTIAWKVHLNFTCSLGIAPVYGGRTKIYVVAENAVLRINSLNIGTQSPVVEVFLAPEPGADGPGEIIGLSASMLTSSVYINIKHRGLFSYTLRGQLAWSAGPVLDRFGYVQGCKENVTGCYFTSVPVIDQCEASIYISNNEGQLYSLSVRRPRFKWIQDFSLFDKVFTITPGNNGRLYVTIPAKALVLGLDVLTGDILWQMGIGPLSSMDYTPVVDSNGWISIGSLDGFLYSVSPTGTLNKLSTASSRESVIQVSPIVDCSGHAVYIAQTQMEGKTSQVIGDYHFIFAMKPTNVVFTLLVPAAGSIYWSESYPGPGGLSSILLLAENDLHSFILDEGILLAFVAASKTGNLLPCRSSRERLAASCSQARTKSLSIMYTGNERAILLFLVFETTLLFVLAIVVRFCCIFWAKKKLQNQGLGPFLEKRRSLRVRKKEFDRTISELEQKAAEEATTSDVLDKLSDLLREREGIEKKLSTTYSLGKDTSKVQPPKSLLPLYDSKTKSYSFRGSTQESITLFHHAYDDDASSSDESSSQETATSEYSAEENMDHLFVDPKGKAPAHGVLESSGDDSSGRDHFHSSNSSMFASRPSDFVNPPLLLVEHEPVEERMQKNDVEAGVIKMMQSGSGSIRRRTTLSSTN
ncbi:hypothetical protein Dimus_033955 [Dionaea muscipula]